MSHTFHRYKIGDEPVAGYRLVSHLGAGGFGEVWKANAPGGTEVALKIIDLTGQQGTQEFSSLRVVKKVRHPNLISLQAFWMKDEEGQIIDDGGEPAPNNNIQATAFYPGSEAPKASSNISMTTRFARPVELIIAMQLGSMSLHKRLEDCREQGLPGVPVAELLEYLEQAARGIDFLNKPIHDLGKGPVPIVHGDVKPHNILVVGDAAVVCDFGLARAVETLRKTSMAPVTVAYAAPESFKGKVTPTSDQYSLAITYAELRTGRLPFDETMTPYQVMEAHVTRTLDFARLPDPERDVVMRATEGNPEDRWPTSRDMILALRHAVAQTGELPLRPGEAAYMSGPTPSHSLTARPQIRGTDLPTRHPVDPSRETSHPGGHTPSQAFSMQTAPSPYETVRRGGMSDSDFRDATAAKKKSKAPLIIGVTILLTAIAAGVIVMLGPKLMNSGNTVNPSATVSNNRPSTGTTGQPSASTPSNVPQESTASQENSATTPSTKSPETPPTEATPVDENSKFIQDVQKDINNNDFNAALDLLGKASSSLPGYEKENLQKRLKTAFLAYIDSIADQRSYSRALNELDDASSGIGLTPEDKQKTTEKIHAAWLAKAQEELQNGQPTRAMDIAKPLLKRFEGDRDAQLVIARCQVRQGDYAAALADLNKLGKTTDLPAQYQPLHAGLLLLATGLPASTPADWGKVLDDFLAYLALEKGTPPPAELALNSWERSRVESLRTQVTDNVQPLLKTLPADQATALAGKLEQLGSSAELEMFKVKTALDGKNYDAARKTLKTHTDKLPADSDLKSEAAATNLLITLRDPATKPADASKAVADSSALLGKITPVLRSMLCEAAEALALNSQPDLLDATTKLTITARDLDPVDKPTQDRLARLLTAKLLARAAQPTAPTAQEVPQLLQDFELIEAAGINNPTLDAFHAECLLGQSSPNRQDLAALLDRAKPADAYTGYVQARVLRLAPQTNWNQIAGLLVAGYPEPAKPTGLLAVPYRRAEATELLIKAAAGKRSTAAPTAATVLANPFGEDKIAAEVFHWLNVAREVSGGIDEKDLKQEKREMWTNFTLAANWKPKPAPELAQNQSARLAKFSNTELGASAFPILYVAFKTHGIESTEPIVSVQAAQRMAEMFQKQFPVADPQAVTFYTNVIQPALATADALSSGKSSSTDLDQFHAAVAEFISHYQRAAKWPFADKQAEIEKLISAAIKLNPKVAKYYTTRGVARISITPPNVEGALSDADAAVKIDANLPAAYALQGHALIYRSRQQPSSEARRADLEKALTQCKLAVDKSKPDDKERSMHLLYLSMAQLERANFDSDPKVKKELLDQAVANARQAVDLEKAYPDYAYTALGNALEDVAWQVGDDPEKNYRAAVDAFSQAISDNPAAPTPLISRARSTYRAIAESKLDPKVLGGSLDEVIQAAIADLQQAKQLSPNSVEPNLWLGKANQLIGKFDDADAALGEAVKLADEQKLPERAMFLVEWTRNAAMNKALPDADRAKLVRERAEQLKAAPSIGGASSAKQAALIIGESLLGEKPPKVADALKEYDAALADYDKADPAKQPLDPNKADGSDVSLLLARSAAHLNPTSEWNSTIAENLLKDVVRINQLKPGPRTVALADWYSANAKTRSVLSSSPTFTPQKKKEFNDSAIDDIRKAIELAPDDPDSWQWRWIGSRLLGAKITPAATPPETIKTLGTEARKWIDDAIEQVSKRPDLASSMLHSSARSKS